MWSALSSDLKEFVSTVAEDTNDVLSAIDSKLTDEEKRRGIATPMKGKEDGGGGGSGSGVGVPAGENAAGTSGSVDVGQGAASSGEVMIGVDGDVIYDSDGGAEGGFDATGLLAAAADEVARLRGLEETYTTPLLLNEDDFGNTKPKAEAEAKDTDAPTEEKAEEGAGTATATADEAAGEGDADEMEDGWGDDLGDDDEEIANTGKSDEALSSPPDVTEEQEQKDGIALDVDDSAADIEDEDDDEEYKEVRAFLTTFDIESKTDDIATVLELYPDTVKANFENLVPTAVTYEQFWQRYYYRCDEDRVVRAWEAERERARVARQEAISAGVASVKNLGNSLFGGAVRALGNVSQVVAPPSAAVGSAAPASTGSSAYEKFQAEFKEQQRAEAAAATGGSGSGGVAAGIGSAIFRTSGRPPFVMNTAQDDDDEYEEGSDVGSAEDEEVLGWSDDDDDLDDLDEEVGVDDMEEVPGDGEDDTEEQIEFAPANNEEAERLQSLLSTTEEERDQLHQTIDLQRKEIEKLREAVPAPPTDPADGDSADEIEKLKLQIFEKDSELAAMRASEMDSSHWVESPTKDKGLDSSSVDASELEEIQRELAEKNDDIANLKERVADLTFEAKQINADLYVAKGKLEELTTAKEDAVESATELEARMASEVAAKDEEIARLKGKATAAAAAADKAKAEVTAARSELDETLTAADVDKSQNSADLEARIASEVAGKNEEIAQLKEEITNLAFEAKQANSDLATTRSELEEAIAAAEEKASEHAADLEARIASAVSAKDEEMTRLRQEAGAATTAVEESKAELSAKQSQLEEANLSNALLKGEIQSVSGSTSETQSQLEELGASLAESEAKLSSVTEAAISEQEMAENKIQTVVAQLEDAKQASRSSDVRSASLEEELQKLREEMEKQGIEFAHKLEEEIAKVKAENEVTSMSSGEKIESVSPVPQTPAASTSPSLSAERFSTPAADEEEDDEDGWGDDWGSDDDL